MTPEVWQTLGIIFGPAGAVGLTLKVMLNGARDDIRETRADVKAIRDKVESHGERLASLEAKEGA